MSWLLITAVPSLLMLATVGLERIETGLDEVQTANPQVQPPQRADHV